MNLNYIKNEIASSFREVIIFNEFNYIKNEIVIIFKEIVSFWLQVIVLNVLVNYGIIGGGITRTFNEIVELFAT